MITQAQSRTEYEQAYIEAHRLYCDNHTVDAKGDIVHHAPKWTRRVR